MLRPMGDYSLTSVAGNLLVVAGMTPRDETGRLVSGVVGHDVSLDEARAAAAVATRRALAAAAGAGAPGPVGRVVSLTVYVRCTDRFTALSDVADGASAEIGAHFPDAPQPARAAVGVISLPGGAPVEVCLTCLAPDAR